MTETGRVLEQKRTALEQAATDSDPGFQEWLKQSNLTADMPGLIAQFFFDELSGTNQFANALSPTTSALPSVGTPSFQAALAKLSISMVTTKLPSPISWAFAALGSIHDKFLAQSSSRPDECRDFS